MIDLIDLCDIVRSVSWKIGVIGKLLKIGHANTFIYDEPNAKIIDQISQKISCTFGVCTTVRKCGETILLASDF